MSEVRDPNDREDDKARDATLVERGALRTRKPLEARASTHKPGKAPVFEETFAAEEGSDAGEPRTLILGQQAEGPTSLWSGTESEPKDAAEPEHDALEESTDPTRVLHESELSEVTAPTRAADVDPHAWYLGRSFGGFRIVRAIAAGGMATVFLARKEGPARVSKHAAIKVVHPHLAYEREFVHMFLDEARIAALIDHPNVCHVLDFGMAEGTYYLAMEYLLGETWSTVRNALADHPDGARMLPAVTAHVLAQACEGLHAAHEALDDSGRALCIVHRDVSPQNIFVAYDGTVRVLDFGIARAADRITSTRDGILKGRLAYMSPEQMSIGDIGPAADIWAIGVVLREALEGKRLFRRASDAETMLAVTQEPLPVWSDGLPEALRAIADRALSRDPALRQASAGALAGELAQYGQSTRTQLGSSELSVWMGLLFGAEMEQKRALLQLPLPEAPTAGAPLAPPPLLEEAEPSEASLPAHGPSTAPARLERRSSSQRPTWVNFSALIALGTVGAIVGLLLGRVVHREPSREPLRNAAPRGTLVAPPQPVVDQLRPRPQQPVISQLAPSPKEGIPTVAPLDSDDQAALEPPAGRRTPRSSGPAPLTGASDEAPGAGIKIASRPAKSASSEPAALAPAARDTGTLLVAFEGGWAEVSLGGKRLGTTPGRFVVPAGKQTLSVRPFGTGKPFAKRVELAPNQVLKVFLAAPKP